LKVVLKHRLFYHFCLIYDGRYWTVSKFLCEMFILCTWIPTTFKYISFLFFQFLLFSVCIISFCYSVLCMVLFQLSSKFGFIISSKWYLNLFSKKKLPWRWSKNTQAHFSLMSQWLRNLICIILALEVPLIFFFMHPSQVFIDLVDPKSLSLSLYLSIYLSLSLKL